MISIDDIRSVLKSEHGWFEPNMESKQYIFDIKVKNYPSIEVRVITGVPKDGQTVKLAYAKVLAIKFGHNNKVNGWVKSSEVSLNTIYWKDDLLEACRKMWKRSVARAKKEGILKEGIKVNV